MPTLVSVYGRSPPTKCHRPLVWQCRHHFPHLPPFTIGHTRVNRLSLSRLKVSRLLSLCRTRCRFPGAAPFPPGSRHRRLSVLPLAVHQCRPGRRTRSVSTCGSRLPAGLHRPCSGLLLFALSYPGRRGPGPPTSQSRPTLIFYRPPVQAIITKTPGNLS